MRPVHEPPTDRYVGQMTAALTILGVSVRAAVAAARRAGFAPYGIDLFADMDAAIAGSAVKIDRYPEGFLTALRAAPLAPWIYAGGLENHSRLVTRLARERPLLGNAADVLGRIRDPAQLKRALVASRLNYPSVEPKANPQPRVFKPLRSGGGRGVQLALAGDSRPPPAGWYEQQYIDGQAASALFVASAAGCHLLGTSRQLSGTAFGAAEPFGYAGSIAPLKSRPAVTRQFEAIGAALCKHFGLKGVFGVDAIVQDDSVWTVEVNPRLTASAEVVERATGRNAVAMHVTACLGQAIAMPARQEAASRLHGKAVVYARSNCSAGENLSRLIVERSGGEWPVLADLPAPGSRFAAGEPIVTVFAEGTTEAGVIEGLRARTEEVLQAMNAD